MHSISWVSWKVTKASQKSYCLSSVTVWHEAVDPPRCQVALWSLSKRWVQLKAMGPPPVVRPQHPKSALHRNTSLQKWCAPSGHVESFGPRPSSSSPPDLDTVPKSLLRLSFSPEWMSCSKPESTAWPIVVASSLRLKYVKALAHLLQLHTLATAPKVRAWCLNNIGPLCLMMAK